MDLTRTAAIILTLIGLALVVTGVSLVSVPAGFVTAGVGVGLVGLFAVNVDAGERQ